MGCPSDKAIKINFLNPKINIDSVYYFSWNVSEQILGHLNIVNAIFSICKNKIQKILLTILIDPIYWKFKSLLNRKEHRYLSENCIG